MQRSKRPALIAGALAGLALTAATLVRSVPAALPGPGVAAVVGVRVIREDAVERAALRLGLSPEDPVARRKMVDYLVDEELLVGRALDLGLARSDPAVRKTLAARMIDRVVAGAGLGSGGAAAAVGEEPTRADLRSWFEENRDRFTTPERARVRRIRISGSRPDAAERARSAHARLEAGEPFERVRDALGDDEVVPIPDDLLTPGVLRRYLGAEAAAAVLELSTAGYTVPIAAGRGFSIVELVELQPAVRPSFEDAETSVRAFYSREAGERRLREALQELRAQTTVRLAAGGADARP
ncbi:MAG: peptidylprolyl isomerase [Candidatus Binatia bacterium]